MSKYNHAEFSLTNKRAAVTDEERRLIDAAVAAGKVQKVPTGKTTLEPEYIWGRDSKGKEGLVLKNPISRAQALENYKSRLCISRNRTPDPRIAKRRAEVLRLSLEGYSAPQIAEHLCCHKVTIRNDRRYLQKKGDLPKLSSSPLGIFAKDIDNRREQVAKLYAQGVSLRAMGEMFGVSKTAIQADVKILKSEGKTPQTDKIAAE